jgi:hypothetical protein
MRRSILKSNECIFREIEPSASWAEDAIIEQDVSVEIAGKNQTSHHEVGAHETHPEIARPQTIRELPRQDDKRGAVALLWDTQDCRESRRAALSRAGTNRSRSAVEPTTTEQPRPPAQGQQTEEPTRYR